MRGEVSESEYYIRLPLRPVTYGSRVLPHRLLKFRPFFAAKLSTAWRRARKDSFLAGFERRSILWTTTGIREAYR